MMTSGKQPVILDVARVENGKLREEPFEFCIAHQALRPQFKSPLMADFPGITHTGSLPLTALHYGPVFSQLLNDLTGEAFQTAVGRKFNLDLGQYDKMITVRGRCSEKSDGHIHTDSKDKIVSVLLYLNDDWQAEGGRLRLLHSRNLEDYAAEITPSFGELLMFRRCGHSYHGHKPYAGKRLSIQMNWVKTSRYRVVQGIRHRWSFWLKSRLAAASARHSARRLSNQS